MLGLQRETLESPPVAATYADGGVSMQRENRWPTGEMLSG
jgi:hypothetical protein